MNEHRIGFMPAPEQPHPEATHAARVARMTRDVESMRSGKGHVVFSDLADKGRHVEVRASGVAGALHLEVSPGAYNPVDRQITDGSESAHDLSTMGFMPPAASGSSALAFSREIVTDPSDAVAQQLDGIFTDVLGARPDFILEVQHSWDDAPSDVAHGPALSAFTRDMIKAYLDAMKYAYDRDDRGNFFLGFRPPAPTGQALRVNLVAGGPNGQIYEIYVYATPGITTGSLGQAVGICNDWNLRARWPKAYVTTNPEKTQGGITLEYCADFSLGATQEMVDLITKEVVDMASNFWSWVSDAYAPLTRPAAGTADPADTTVAPAPAAPAAAARPPRPAVDRGRLITAYTDQELDQMATWVVSDGANRTEDALVTEVAHELGCIRIGRRIDHVVRAAVQRTLGHVPAGAA